MNNHIHKYTICAGSNSHNASEQINKAYNYINALFKQTQISKIIKTEPEETKNNYLFNNAVIVFHSNMDFVNVKKNLKSIEDKLGRTKSSNLIMIDLDIIKIDNNIVHIDYYKRKYIKPLILSISK